MKIQIKRLLTIGMLSYSAFVLTSTAHADPAQSNGATLGSSRTRVSVNINIGSNQNYSSGYLNNGYGYSSGYPNYGAPRYGNSTIVVVPGYGYPNYGGGNVVVIGNGTTVINNGGYGYGYPYGYPIVNTPQFYNYGPGGFTRVDNGGGYPSYNNINSINLYGSVPASTYSFDPSRPTSAGNYDSDWNRWSDSYSLGNYAGLNSSGTVSRNSRTTTSRRAARLAATNPAPANVIDNSITAVTTATTTAAAENGATETQWADGAQWSANEDGKAAVIPTWPTDTK